MSRSEWMHASMSSRSKSAVSCDVVICTSMPGCSAWKAARRGTSHRIANVGGSLRRSRFPVGARLHLPRREVDLVERAVDRPEVRGTLRGQRDAALRPGEQRGAEPAFERGDVPAHGALGHAQLARGAGDAAVARDGVERPDGVERWHSAQHRSDMSFYQHHYALIVLAHQPGRSSIAWIDAGPPIGATSRSVSHRRNRNEDCASCSSRDRRRSVRGSRTRRPTRHGRSG